MSEKTEITFMQTRLIRLASVEWHLSVEQIIHLFKEANVLEYIEKYDVWSRYEPEDKGVLIAYSSVYGNTKAAVEALAECIGNREKVVLADLAREDMAEVIEDAFRYDRLVVASPTYDGGLFPAVESFLNHLKAKAYQKRTVFLIENGSWAPMAAKKMAEAFSEMKDIHVAEKSVTIKSALNDESLCAIKELAEEIVKA